MLAGIEIRLAFFYIGVLDACIEKNATSHNIIKQLISKYTELIENNSDNAIISLK